jgi:pSer/pThr/pTyr-binding forkhead associated (FHA) protein
VKLELRHLSGSRTGEVASFDDASEVSIGRHPSNRVAFDPNQDRSVSGNHASITFQNGRWMLRDLGSSNGTFVNDQRVTEHELRSGDVVQFGAQGPKVRVALEGAAHAEAAPVDEPAVPAEGRTVMMMLPPESGGPTSPSPVAMPRKKKGGMGRALMIVGAIGVVLLLGLVALALVIRSSNIRKKRATAQTASTSTTSTAAPAQTTAPVTATETAAPAPATDTAQTQQLEQQIAATKQTIDSAQQSVQKGDQSSTEIADLKRQIAESQALMEQMTRQLQEKNDQIAQERARASAQPKVVYVPTAAPSSPTPAQPAAQQPAQPTASATRTEQYAAPAPSAPAPTRPTTAAKTPKGAQPVAATGAAALPPLPALYKNKPLKIKVTINSTPPEIPPANLPSGTDRGLVSMIGSALISSGDYVVGPNGQANVSVMVTNYKADQNRNVNTQAVSSSARKIGKLFGQKVPTNPVDVKNVAYDAAMSARVRLLDRTGRVLLETEPSSASADRKAKVGLAGVSFNDTVLSDTAIGDVQRKVVADAVDALRGGLASLDWSTVVTGASKEKIMLGVGSSAKVEPGDMFEITDGTRVLNRARVTSVTENGSEAMLLAPPGKEKLANLTAVYLGNENAAAPVTTPRTITIRSKSGAFSGPGNSFTQVRELKPGTRLKLHFTVGPWAKAEDGNNGTLWVPLTNVTIGS